jgi:hypothetical protein
VFADIVKELASSETSNNEPVTTVDVVINTDTQSAVVAVTPPGGQTSFHPHFSENLQAGLGAVWRKVVFDTVICPLCGVADAVSDVKGDNGRIAQVATIASVASAALGIAATWFRAGAAAEGGTTTLFRAVNEAEFAQIMRDGVFKQGPNSLEGKWFATTAKDAASWGSLLGNPRLVSAEVATSTVKTMYHATRLDAIGPAVYAELSQLSGAIIRSVR